MATTSGFRYSYLQATLIGSILTGGIGFVGCKGAETATGTVERKDLVGYTRLEASLIVPPNAKASVFALHSLPIKRVYAAQGQAVKQGQILIELSYPSAEAALIRARENLASAEAELKRAEAQYDAPIRAARIELARAKAIADDQTPMADIDSNTQSADAAVRSASAALEQAIAEKEASLIQFRQRVEAAREHLASAKSGAQVTSLKAPISGVVTMMNATPGETVPENYNAPLATIVDLEKLEVQVPIPEKDSEMIQKGGTALLTFSSSPGKQFTGQIDRIIYAPTDSQDVRRIAIIRFDNDGSVKPNSTVTMCAARLGEVKDALTVPNGAIITNLSGQKLVRVRQNGYWKSVRVDLGMEGLDRTEIKNGLLEGQTVEVRMTKK